MCGIAGYFGKHLISKANINRTLQKMRQRGPDFSNHFSKSYPNNLFIYLLHSRLSIIDLHPRSNQPFIIGDDVIIFKGEIYNYLEIPPFKHRYTNLDQFEINGIKYNDRVVGEGLHSIKTDRISKSKYDAYSLIPESIVKEYKKDWLL